jgi:acetyl esterase/lipase
LVHGGGWQAGTRAGYRYWGPFLAERGYVAFAISYRLSTPQQPNYPQAVQDVKAAVQFLRARGADLKVDPERIGIMGDSAGGHLAALVALSADSPRFANPESPYASISSRVKVAVPVYGVFDLVKQWEHDQLARPRDQITEKHLGGAPMDIMDVFLEASPINWATRHNNAASFLVVYGTADDIVDYQTQSVPFINALKRAGIYTRTVPMQGAPHFWMWDPIDEPNSWPGFLAPRLLRFLAERL